MGAYLEEGIIPKPILRTGPAHPPEISWALQLISCFIDSPIRPIQAGQADVFQPDRSRQAWVSAPCPHTSGTSVQVQVYSVHQVISLASSFVAFACRRLNMAKWHSRIKVLASYIYIYMHSCLCSEWSWLHMLAGAWVTWFNTLLASICNSSFFKLGILNA